MMKAMGVLLLLAGVSAAAADQKKEAPPPACGDEEVMVADYRKTLTELVGTVKTESLDDFRRAYHRKSCLTKLMLCTTVVEGAVACFEHAAQDTSTPKAQAETYKTKRDGYAKLKDRVGRYRDALKAAEIDEDAKPLIEEMNFTE